MYDDEETFNPELTLDQLKAQYPDMVWTVVSTTPDGNQEVQGDDFNARTMPNCPDTWSTGTAWIHYIWATVTPDNKVLGYTTAADEYSW